MKERSAGTLAGHVEPASPRQLAAIDVVSPAKLNATLAIERLGLPRQGVSEPVFGIWLFDPERKEPPQMVEACSVEYFNEAEELADRWATGPWRVDIRMFPGAEWRVSPAVPGKPGKFCCWGDERAAADSHRSPRPRYAHALYRWTNRNPNKPEAIGTIGLLRFAVDPTPDVPKVPLRVVQEKLLRVDEHLRNAQRRRPRKYVRRARRELLSMIGGAR